jgi:hypothetical protein
MPARRTSKLAIGRTHMVCKYRPIETATATLQHDAEHLQR